jgi:hypothetical protein
MELGHGAGSSKLGAGGNGFGGPPKPTGQRPVLPRASRPILSPNIIRSTDPTRPRPKPASEQASPGQRGVKAAALQRPLGRDWRLHQGAGVCGFGGAGLLVSAGRQNRPASGACSPCLAAPTGRRYISPGQAQRRPGKASRCIPKATASCQFLASRLPRRPSQSVSSATSCWRCRMPHLEHGSPRWTVKVEGFRRAAGRA